MGKESQKGILIVWRKVIWKGEGFKDDLRCRWGESFICSALTCQPLSQKKKKSYALQSICKMDALTADYCCLKCDLYVWYFIWNKRLSIIDIKFLKWSILCNYKHLCKIFPYKEQILAGQILNEKHFLTANQRKYLIFGNYCFENRLQILIKQADIFLGWNGLYFFNGFVAIIFFQKKMKFRHSTMYTIRKGSGEYTHKHYSILMILS